MKGRGVCARVFAFIKQHHLVLIRVDSSALRKTPFSGPAEAVGQPVARQIVHLVGGVKELDPITGFQARRGGKAVIA